MIPDAVAAEYEALRTGVREMLAEREHQRVTV